MGRSFRCVYWPDAAIGGRSRCSRRLSCLNTVNRSDRCGGGLGQISRCVTHGSRIALGCRYRHLHIPSTGTGLLRCSTAAPGVPGLVLRHGVICLGVTLVRRSHKRTPARYCVWEECPNKMSSGDGVRWCRRLPGMCLAPQGLAGMQEIIRNRCH